MWWLEKCESRDVLDDSSWKFVCTHQPSGSSCPSSQRVAWTARRRWAPSSVFGIILDFIRQFSFLLCVSPQLSHLHLSVVSVSSALYSCTVYTVQYTGTRHCLPVAEAGFSRALILYNSHMWSFKQGPSSGHWHDCCLPACSAWFTLDQGHRCMYDKGVHLLDIYF